MSSVADVRPVDAQNVTNDPVGNETVCVTVVDLAGDVVYGPQQVASTLTVGELKTKFAHASPKALVHGERVVGNSELLSSFSEPLFRMVLLDLTEMSGAIGGAWFGSHHIPKVHDEELEREVFKLQGVSWFACGGEVHDVPAIPVRVGFRVKRTDRLTFRPAVICKINGEEVRRTRLQDALLTEGEWEVLDFGTCDVGGTVRAEMVGEDVVDRGQSSKSGLFVDRMVISVD
eukprot:CAMPEP_0194543884 /NCGR_PEP_ID=MMETSP0253-20130528/86602_1 /TAXON_ID=2966 /ORGANISM="Noctiluca scintillans" /LENGTH=230 /DNA_ID=CAMNT_0039390697 /DNA_START=51 /DNA_END=743 /DNA_ORIENTATION=-